jgi:hypothetical protein
MSAVNTGPLRTLRCGKIPAERSYGAVELGEGYDAALSSLTSLVERSTESGERSSKSRFYLAVQTSLRGEEYLTATISSSSPTHFIHLKIR